METVKLLGICGSPRKTGNSRYLLEAALSAAKDFAPELVETELYSMAGKHIAPCTSCNHCEEEIGVCTIRDDFQELRAKWLGADALIYSVPVYHLGIPGQLKCFIDRLGMTRFYRNSDGMLAAPKDPKTVGIVVQGLGFCAGQDLVTSTLIDHAVLMTCVPVRGDWPSASIGAAGWTRCEETEDTIRRLYEEGEADAQMTVAGAKTVARRVVQMALVIKGGGAACRDMLAEDGDFDSFLSRLGR